MRPVRHEDVKGSLHPLEAEILSLFKDTVLGSPKQNLSVRCSGGYQEFWKKRSRSWPLLGSALLP